MDSQTAIVIRDIYAAALDKLPWQHVLEKTARLFDATGGFLFTTTLVPEEEGGLGAFHGLPAPEARQFLTEVATVDVWYHELLRRHSQLRTGLQWRSDTLVADKELRRTRFFADYLVPCDIGRCLGAIAADGSAELPRLTPICVYRPVRSRPFSVADDVRLGELRPHFTQALAIRQRLHAATRGSAALAIERVSTAVVVLDRDRRILLANPAAEALFSGSGLSLVREGRLCACEPSQLAALEKAVEACSTYCFDDRLSLSVRLGGAPGNGVVVRLAPPPLSARKAGKAVAIAFLAREGRSALDLRSIVATLYRLTPMEAALVKALSEGMTPEMFAEIRHVGLATVKTQLRSVFAKTGTRRQSDLMRLVYSIAR